LSEERETIVPGEKITGGKNLLLNRVRRRKVPLERRGLPTADARKYRKTAFTYLRKGPIRRPSKGKKEKRKAIEERKRGG